MFFSLFLHIYQPPTQSEQMIQKITRESYARIVDLLEKYPRARITLNITASLSEQLYRLGERGLLERIARLAATGQVELTSSAAYHPILPDLPKSEITRQIKLNERINRSYFGSAYKPQGFFPPELAYSDRVAEVLQRLNYKWILVDGSALPSWERCIDWVYQREGSQLLAFSREDGLSYKIAFGKVRTMMGIKRYYSSAECKKHQYVVLAMDGETFGHHQPKQLNLLEDIFRKQETDQHFQLETVSNLVQIFPKRRAVPLLYSTWGYVEDIEGEWVWVRWRNPENPVHSVLNEIRSLALKSVSEKEGTARELFDKALNSDTYWWSSGKPYWHPGMVSDGVKLFADAVKYSETATEKQKNRMRYLVSHTLPQVLMRLRTRNQREKILGGKGRA